MTSRRSPQGWWTRRAEQRQRLQLVPPVPRMIGPIPLYPLPMPTLLPKPTVRSNRTVAKPAHKTKHLHGGRMAKQYRHERTMPAKVKLPVVQQPILSDSEWCAFPPFPNRKAIPYRALTSTGHIEVPRTEAQAIRLEAGASLAKSLRSKQALTSGKVMGHAAAG